MFLFSLISKALYKLFNRFFKKQEIDNSEIDDYEIEENARMNEIRKQFGIKEERAVVNKWKIDKSLPPLQFVLDISQFRDGQKDIIAETRDDFRKRMKDCGINDIIFTPQPTPSKQKKSS